MLKKILITGILIIVSVVFALPAEGAGNKQVKTDSTEIVQDSLKKERIKEIMSFHKPFCEKIGQSEWLGIPGIQLTLYLLLALTVLSWILLCLYKRRDEHDWLNTVWCILLLLTQILIFLFNGMKTSEYDYVRAFTGLGFSWDSIRHFLLVFSVTLFIIGSVYWSCLIFIRDSGIKAPMLLVAPPVTIIGIYATLIILSIVLKSTLVQKVGEIAGQIILGLYGLVIIGQLVHVVVQARRELLRSILLGIYVLITMLSLLYYCYVILSMGFMFICMAFGVLFLVGGATKNVKQAGKMSGNYKVIRHVDRDGNVKIMRMPKGQNTDGVGMEI